MYTNCLLGACLALLVGCATVNTPPAQTAYARVEANIPGWGAIVDVRRVQVTDSDAQTALCPHRLHRH